MQAPLVQRGALRGRLAAQQPRRLPPRAGSRPDHPCVEDGVDFGHLGKALIAAAAAVALTGCTAGAARADSGWRPRRHHRHIGERYADDWADVIVEGQENDRQTIRDLQRQLAQERRRADDEATKRLAAEQKARAATLQQASRAAFDDDGLLSIRLLGADVTGPLTFALLLGGGWYAYTNDLVGQLTGRRRGRKGRWVYDRSLGGKKVWVPELVEGEGEGQLPDHMSNADFESLAATAASKAASSGGGGAAAREDQWEPPAWWDRPGVLPVASEADRSARFAAAERILRRIETAKNRGEDYDLGEILALRSACMSAGGASLDARTVGARDAIYRAAVEAGIASCLDPGSVDLGGYPPVRLAAGVASDVSLPERRAVPALMGAVAGACRGRIVEALASLEKRDDGLALLALSQLSALLEGMPVLDEASVEVALVADELNSWAPVAAREKILLMVVQMDEPRAPLVARLMALRPEEAMPRIRAQLGGGGSGGDDTA
ncbi:MAG: hypothetical protein J3K34DRAFT_279684 [Monoraphidium minutum]|nr:MAG: hypothetical protein J3K34DRAFT_279684 [Monoraphidium minutum]